MSRKEDFLTELGSLLDRYPEYRETFTISAATFEQADLSADSMGITAEAPRCCEYGRIPGDGYVCLRWCD